MSRSLKSYLTLTTRDKLGRFVDTKTLRSCSSTNCDVDADLKAAVLEQDAFLATLEQLAADTDPGSAAANAAIIKAYREQLQKDQAYIFREVERQEAAQLRAGAPAQKRDVAFVESVNVDAIDITGLSGRDRARLALRLSKWNPNTKPLFVERNGKKYISSKVRRVNMNDPLLVELGLDEDIREVVRSTGERVSYEDSKQKLKKRSQKRLSVFKRT